jgi:hypothetical protein
MIPTPVLANPSPGPWATYGPVWFVRFAAPGPTFLIDLDGDLVSIWDAK